MTHSAFCNAQGRVVVLNPKDGGKLRSLARISIAVPGLLSHASGVERTLLSASCLDSESFREQNERPKINPKPNGGGQECPPDMTDILSLLPVGVCQGL